MINNPYAIYPGAPFSGYYDMTTYNAELLRLIEYIDELINSLIDNPRQIALHITVGAFMDEYAMTFNKPIGQHVHQLFPDILFQYNTFDIPVEHIIIAPNKQFHPDKFVKPAAMSLYEFNTDADITTRFTYQNITANFFNTMMPHYDQHNDIVISRATEYGIGKYFDISMLRQTDYDKMIISQFYNKLGQLIDRVIDNNGMVSAYSFAIFANKTVEPYGLFPELRTLFNDKRQILAEWVYNTTTLRSIYNDIISYIC